MKGEKKVNKEHAYLLHFSFAYLQNYMKASRKLLALYKISSEDSVRASMKAECVGTDELHSHLDFPRERI